MVGSLGGFGWWCIAEDLHLRFRFGLVSPRSDHHSAASSSIHLCFSWLLPWYTHLYQYPICQHNCLSNKGFQIWQWPMNNHWPEFIHLALLHCADRLQSYHLHSILGVHSSANLVIVVQHVFHVEFAERRSCSKLMIIVYVPCSNTFGILRYVFQSVFCLTKNPKLALSVWVILSG